jgi:hypothetical protein
MTWPWGIIIMRRLVSRRRGDGTPEPPGGPPADVWTCPERHGIPGHSRSRAGGRCIGPRPGGPFDAPATPEGDVTDAKTSRMDGPLPTRRTSARRC